ncbi:MAG: hypothetical protein ACK5WO_00205 [Cyclobacteriaceae bacterium]|jgi:hypothetical protein|nr:hypothetical protein [Flammeovirgaceae bacterium]
MTIWNFIRHRLGLKSRNVFPRTYYVNILITHPLVPHAILRTKVSIDAHDAEHARKQLRESLKITVGRATTH